MFEALSGSPLVSSQGIDSPAEKPLRNVMPAVCRPFT
jgi:hypothetical protein